MTPEVKPGMVVMFAGGAVVRVTKVGRKWVHGVHLATGRRVRTQCGVRVGVDPHAPNGPAV